MPQNAILQFPLLSGAFLLARDKNDPRQNLMFAVVGMILILLALKTYGVETGEVGTTITSAFTILVGYWFGRKEEEHKRGCY